MLTRMPRNENLGHDIVNIVLDLSILYERIWHTGHWDTCRIRYADISEKCDQLHLMVATVSSHSSGLGDAATPPGREVDFWPRYRFEAGGDYPLRPFIR
jgi:hypothetical protein